ncbi:MAG: HAMP domain-containing protein, partial [Acidobacteriota bacterium]
MSLEISFLRSKLARRLFVLFISCALVPTVVLALLSFVHVSHQLSEQSKRRLHRTSKITGLAIHERLVILEIILKSLEGNIAEAPAQPLGGTSRILKERLEERFSAVTVVTAGGTQRAVTRGIESFPELTPPQRRHLAAGKTLLLTLRAADSRPQMVMIRKTSRALAEERHLVGVVRGSYLWNVAAASSFSGGTEFCVLGEANEPLACSLQAPIILPDDVLAAMHRSYSGHFEWQHDGKPYVAYYWSAFLKGAFGMPKLTFVLAEARADVMAPMAAFRSSFPLVVMLAIWVVLLLSTRQIRRSLVPLAELMRGTREIARQRFNTRVEVTSGDEFQDLADSFNSMAERLNKQFRLSVIGEIISGVAHELNNAVTGVVGFSQLVLSRNGDAHIARDLKNVNDSALRCQSIVKNLLDFSRGRKPERMYLHIDGILEKTLELKEHQLSVNGIEVVRNLDPKLPGTMIDFY